MVIFETAPKETRSQFHVQGLNYPKAHSRIQETYSPRKLLEVRKEVKIGPYRVKPPAVLKILTGARNRKKTNSFLIFETKSKISWVGGGWVLNEQHKWLSKVIQLYWRYSQRSNKKLIIIELPNKILKKFTWNWLDSHTLACRVLHFRISRLTL